MRIFIFALAFSLVGCGGAQPEPAAPAEPRVEAEPVETELHRAALDELLSKGPAYTLAMVQTDSVLSGGRFVGFRIVAVRTELPAYLDLEPGDVVQKVNGLPIERPEQFFAVFEKLKTATEVRFDVLRDGAPTTLVYPIVP